MCLLTEAESIPAGGAAGVAESSQRTPSLDGISRHLGAGLAVSTASRWTKSDSSIRSVGLIAARAERMNALENASSSTMPATWDASASDMWSPFIMSSERVFCDVLRLRSLQEPFDIFEAMLRTGN